MGIRILDHEHTTIFGFAITGKLTTEEIEGFLPKMEQAVARSKKKLRLLIDVSDMHGADIRSEWDIFEFLKKYINKDIEYIAIVGSHSWTKVMSAILVESIFVEVETRYFKSDEIEHAWEWLIKVGASAPHTGTQGNPQRPRSLHEIQFTGLYMRTRASKILPCGVWTCVAGPICRIARCDAW